MKKRGVVLCLVFASASAAAVLSGHGSADKNAPALDRRDMELSVRPGDNFFRYACGAWLERARIPDDRSALRTKEIVDAERDRELEALLEKIVARKDAEFGSDVQKIRDFYLTAMDEGKIEAEGAAVLDPDLALIDGLKSASGIPDVLSSFQSFSLAPLFSLAVRTDPKNSGVYSLFLSPGGLGLPDRDYYSAAGEKADQIRGAYLDHVARMLGLVGSKPDEAAEQARAVLAVESRLAEKTLTRLQQRDLAAQYNKMTPPELQALCPAVDWARYLARVGVAPEALIVANPAHLKEVGQMIGEIPLDRWKVFLRWRLVDNLAEFMGPAFARAKFDFYGGFLSGRKSPRPWKDQVLEFVNEGMGEILGRIYVQEYFSAGRKARLEKMFVLLKKSLRARIEALDWMSPSTKAEALAKLEALRLMVGYPDAWQDFSGLEIRPDSFLLNLKRIMAFLIRDNMARCGRAVDRDGWSGIYPHTANAGYIPLRNRIIFPAGILRPPFFYPDADDAVNYGAIGFGLAHEMMHAFDDQGRRYDGDGNLRNWWMAEDEAEFKRRAEVLVVQYSGFKTAEGTAVDGRLSLGENIADVAGLTVAWDAYRSSLKGATPAPIDGFTHEERFYLAFAKVFRGKIRPEALARMMKEDKHPWGEFRVNGAPFHLPDFYRVFDIRPGDKLYLDESRRLRIW